jgi:hypothetical protein
LRVIPELDLSAPGVVMGRHAAWFPWLGVKLPFQWGGLVTKYQHRETSYPVDDTLPHELAILRALAAEGMAPPIGDLVFVETLISEHLGPGAFHADPVGAWGYEMADAEKLPPGRFSVEAMRRLPIAGSDGAWNDISVPGRGNVVNGYLVDVARSRFDALKWTGPDLPTIPRIQVDKAAIVADVHRLCQFPKGERALAYQDFYLDGWQRGERRVVERAALLGFLPKPGESVLEIGCQSGGFLQLAWQATQGIGAVAGVEIDPDYVDCGRRLARQGRANICFQLGDARNTGKILPWVFAYFPRGVSHLLFLSMEKHMGEAAMFRLVDEIGARRTYIETNAVAKDSGAGPPPRGPMKLTDPVLSRGGRYLGDSRDRNLRRLYRIDRPC